MAALSQFQSPDFLDTVSLLVNDGIKKKKIEREALISLYMCELVQVLFLLCITVKCYFVTFPTIGSSFTALCLYPVSVLYYID